MKYLLYLATLVAGAGLGWVYYKLVGCRSGGWSLTSNAWSSVMMGALFLLLFLSPVIDKYMVNRVSDSSRENEIKHESSITENEDALNEDQENHE